MIFIFSENYVKTKRCNEETNIQGIHLESPNQLKSDSIIYKYGYWMDNPERYRIFEKMEKLGLKFSKINYKKGLE